MFREDKTLKLIEIFIVCHDFCNALTRWQTQQGCLPTTRRGEMSDSEMLTLVIFYYFSGYNRVDFYGSNNRNPPGLSSSSLVMINCRLGMILGVNVPSRSRLLSISKCPELRLLTVFYTLPLRRLLIPAA